MAAPSETHPGKLAAAEAAAALVRDGMTVGLGSGSTASLAVRALARRVSQGLRITGIATSEKTAELARELGIPLSTLADRSRIALTIDGADEVELGTLDLIKGLGGALLREKLVAVATERLVIVVDESKLVDRLAADSRPLPVEVVAFAWQSTARRLESLGAQPTLRRAAARPAVRHRSGQLHAGLPLPFDAAGTRFAASLGRDRGRGGARLVPGDDLAGDGGRRWGGARARRRGDEDARRRAALARAGGAASAAPGRPAGAGARPGPGAAAREACGVCRTDLHVVEGELPPLGGPLIPGHQIVGEVVGGGARGRVVDRRHGRRLLVLPARFRKPVRRPHLHRLHGERRLRRVRRGAAGFRLSAAARAGRHSGRARCCAPASSASAACAWPAWNRASAWACSASARRRTWPSPSCAPGSARCTWRRAASRTGGWPSRWARRGWAASTRSRPSALDRAVTFAPSGDVVVAALASLRKGGVVAINAIHLDRIPQFDYDSLLWGERQIRSVANMTRQDARDFLQDCRGDRAAAQGHRVSAGASQPGARSREGRSDRRRGGDCAVMGGLMIALAAMRPEKSGRCTLKRTPHRCGADERNNSGRPGRLRRIAGAPASSAEKRPLRDQWRCDRAGHQALSASREPGHLI